MSANEIFGLEELVRLTSLASEARSLNQLVCTQHELRAALRRAIVSREWSQLEEARRALAGTPSLAARFDENLWSVLEAPELGAQGPGARWRGLVLAIPVSITARSGTLVTLPQPIARALRSTLQERFPPGTGLRLIPRPVPQLVAHAMGPRSLYELIEELASGERGGPSALEPEVAGAFLPHGRSLGRHFLFALVLTPALEQFALELPGDLQTEPRLVKWAADQTEKITSDFAERGWQLLMRVSPPQRLREMLSSPPVLGDVRELDGLLEHAAARNGKPVTTLKADLALVRAGDIGLRILISDRATHAPLAQAFYRFAALGAEGGTYRVAVRLASAGVELAVADETLRGAVQRATTLTSAPVPLEQSTETTVPQPLGLTRLRSRFSRSHRHSN